MRTLVLHPYLHYGCWVFDDERTGLKEEAFVRGASEMISRLVETKRIPHATKGFTMTFAAEPFVGHDAELAWVARGEGDDGWEFGLGCQGVISILFERVGAPACREHLAFLQHCREASTGAAVATVIREDGSGAAEGIGRGHV